MTTISVQESHSPQKEYGDPFEPWIITILSAVIISCFIGVAWLWHAYKPECQAMEYTYCGEETTADDHHSDH